MASDRSDSSLDALLKLAVVGSLVFGALYYFKKLSIRLEEEALARHGAGESDYERRYPTSHQQPHHPVGK